MIDENSMCVNEEIRIGVDYVSNIPFFNIIQLHLIISTINALHEMMNSELVLKCGIQHQFKLINHQRF